MFFGPACFVMLSFLWYFFLRQQWISSGVFLLLVILNVPVTIAGIFAIHRTVGVTSTGLVKAIFAAGNIPPPPTYPRQDVMIARGQYAEAADYFRDHIRIEPGDHEARLQLAQLLETRLQGHDEAERLYQEVRRMQPDPRQEMRAANGLIDLYRRTGRRDRLRVELARFADRYGGTAAGDAAAREVSELKNAPR
ncbi:MAG TPA: tetratricopeptide repeat protein [Gemmatimonadales bacterium]|nr:tetratricopeptide repeat protein [Gemmatimonadales bacterium]